MLKKILAFTAFFALAACGEDVYQDIDKHNEILEQSSTAADDSGGIKPFSYDPLTGFGSPWHIYTRSSIPSRVAYVFNNISHDNTDPTKRLYSGLLLILGWLIMI